MIAINDFKLCLDNFKSIVLYLPDVSTKHKSSGIYCFFIDNFESDFKTPIYVGQSKNIYNRINNHKSKLKN